MKITTHEIARQLNTSQATVSRALRDDPRISTLMRQRIQEVARKLNYKPNHAASALRTGRTQTIGVFCSGFSTQHQRLDEIELAAKQNGLSTILEVQRGQEDLGKRAIQSLLARRVDGILLVGVQLDEQWIDQLKEIKESKVPLVVIGTSSVNDIYPVDLIDWDRVSAYEYLTNHLLERGCRQFLYLGGSQTPGCKMRIQGIRKSLRRFGLTAKALKCALNTAVGSKPCPTHEAVHELIRSDLEKGWPDAVICQTDLQALAVVDLARSMNISCPDALAVTGCSDTEFSALVSPKLTTIRMPEREQSRLAMDRLVKQINQERKSGQSFSKIISGEVVLRQSSLFS